MDRLTRGRFRHRKLATRYFPDPIGSWTTTLTPTEGVWSVVEPAGATLEISPSLEPPFPSKAEILFKGNPVGTYVMAKVQFQLHDEFEFNGLQPNAKLHIRLWSDYLHQGTFAIWLYDINGRVASRHGLTMPVNTYTSFELLTEPTQWTVEPGFAWGHIKRLWIVAATRNIRVNAVYFSYTQIVLATLTIDSVPQGKSYSIGAASGYTPSPPYGLTPDKEEAVTIDPVDFKYWEDGSTANPRLIKLAEAEEKTITAYYVTEPSPGKGKLICLAFADSIAVAASVEVVTVGTYTTPFEIELDPKTYLLRAEYKGQKKEASVLISEDKISEVKFAFVKTNGDGIDWGNLALAGVAFVFAIVISKL